MGRVSRCMVVILHMADSPHKAPKRENRGQTIVSGTRKGGRAIQGPGVAANRDLYERMQRVAGYAFTPSLPGPRQRM